MPRFARPMFYVTGLLTTAALAGTFLPNAVLAQEHGSRDAQAEQFVGTNGSKVLAILNNRQEDRTDKDRSFRSLIDQVVDVPRVTHFVLGKYARSIAPDQYRRFAAVFREYAEGVYQSRIDDYHGEKFTVNGSVVRKPGDVIVTTTLFGGKMTSPTVVQWRVLGSAGSYRVVDVQVSGVWLAITQQQDFVSTIDNAGGNINALITQLQNGKGEAIHRKT